MDEEMTFRELVDLASERMGGSVRYSTDDFFAEKENLLKPHKAVWKEHEYTDRGKWMDGWESRRKRTPGHDFAIVRLGAPGVVRGVVVDTSFFRGNYPESCSFDGCTLPPEADADALLAANWVEILPRTALKGDSENEIAVDFPYAVTHLRFHIYPDGGVARLRVHGEVVPNWHRLGGLRNEVDLAAVEHGGEVLGCSDMFFGPKHNLIMPGRAVNMSDGWETRRRRGPGHDWVDVRLACEGVVRRVEIDTAHFKGNYPDTASIDPLLPRTKLQADTRHIFIEELTDAGPITQLRLNVYPDGGVSRLRVFGTATENGRAAVVTRRVNTMLDDAELRRVCGSSEWVRRMMAARPLANAFATSDEIWASLGRDDVLEAFAAHPRIGEKKGGAWSAREQSGAAAATDQTMNAMAEANAEYERRFGYIYIVCATGKSADEMLAIAWQRLTNEPDAELRVAAEEQRKIMQLRLWKLVE
jgi:allantoicase